AMAEPGFFHLVGQKSLYLALGGRGEFDCHVVVQFAGDRIEEELWGRDVAEFGHGDLAEIRLAVLTRSRAARRRADMPTDAPLEGIELDPVFEAVRRNRSFDIAVFHVECHGKSPSLVRNLEF